MSALKVERDGDVLRVTDVSHAPEDVPIDAVHVILVQLGEGIHAGPCLEHKLLLFFLVHGHQGHFCLLSLRTPSGLLSYMQEAGLHHAASSMIGHCRARQVT